MEYYLASKKKEILKYAIVQMNLKDIMINKTSQTQQDNTTWFHLHEESKIV